MMVKLAGVKNSGRLLEDSFCIVRDDLVQGMAFVMCGVVHMREAM